MIVLLLFLAIFGLAEFLYSKKVDVHITRKVVHIGGALVSALFPLFVDIKTVVLLGLAFFIILAVSKSHSLLNSIHKVDDETVGALIFAPGVVLTALIFWPVNVIIFQMAILVLGLSDGFACLIGRKYGKHKYRITSTKSIEGSLTFFFVTIIILLGAIYINNSFGLERLMLAIVGSTFLAAIEAVSSKGWDNLLIPIFSGTVLYFIL